MCSFVCANVLKNLSVYFSLGCFHKECVHKMHQNKCSWDMHIKFCSHHGVLQEKKCLANEILFFEIDYPIFFNYGICVGADNDKFLFFSLTDFK